MTYWTWSGHNDELPTLHVFGYGLWNLWDDGLTVENHWLDADPPTLKPEVLQDILDWGGEWHPNSLEVHFHSGNADGAMMWKLKYPSNSGCTSPDTDDEIGGEKILWIK